MTFRSFRSRPTIDVTLAQQFRASRRASPGAVSMAMRRSLSVVLLLAAGGGWAEVLLDLDFSGSDGETAAADASPAAHAVTFHGALGADHGAEISTAQFVSAPSSVQFTGGYLSVASAALTILESFTIDFDMYATDWGSTKGGCSVYCEGVVLSRHWQRKRMVLACGRRSFHR